MFGNIDIKVKEFELDGVKFYIRAMNPFEALKLQGDLAKLISPIIGKVGKAFSQGKSETEKVSISSILESDFSGGLEGVFNAIAENIDGDKLAVYMRRILEPRYVAYQTVTMDNPKQLDESCYMEVFSGNLSGMYLLAWEVLKHNFGDFFSRFSSLSGIAKAQLTSQK